MSIPAPGSEPVVFRVTVASEELGLAPGDDVVFNPRTARQFTHCRAVDPEGLRRHFRAFGLTPMTSGPLPPGFTFAKRRPKKAKVPKVDPAVPSRPPIQRGRLTLVDRRDG